MPSCISRLVAASFLFLLLVAIATGADAPKGDVTFPPELPDGQANVTDESPDFLKPVGALRDGVTIAKTAPKIDFAFYPGQTYKGNPWSNWGDSLAANGKYYASIGDHLAPAGNGFVYEYDPASKKFRQLVDLKKLLNLPEGHYAPGKIHSRLDMGDDGYLYFATHRGSTRVTTDQYHYKGDWIARVNPETGKAEVVAHGPVPKHCIPNSVLDPQRLIFYGGTAPGEGNAAKNIHFFAYDVKSKKVLCDVPDGPGRYMIFAKSTGRVYYTPGAQEAPLMRYDPEQGGDPQEIEGRIGIRSATQETPQGIVYTASNGQGDKESMIYAFNTKSEKVEVLGPAPVAKQQYIASIDADPTGRYLYYVLGAHGGGDLDGSAVVQFDVKTKQRKVIAFLHPYFKDKYGCILQGTYSTAVDSKGDKLYVTWNVSRKGKVWDCCALTVIHIPESERMP